MYVRSILYVSCSTREAELTLSSERAKHAELNNSGHNQATFVTKCLMLNLLREPLNVPVHPFSLHVHLFQLGLAAATG